MSRPAAIAAGNRLLTPLLSAVLIGVWINILTNYSTHLGYFKAILKIGYTNLFLIAAFALLAAQEVIRRRLGRSSAAQLRQAFELLRPRERRLLETTLGLVCELISKTLRVQCNARYFTAVSDKNSAVSLEQDRDLAILNIPMPHEYGFTRINVDTPHIISARAYKQRTPIFEELPEDHLDNYSSDLALMIEPAQRWVLACPVLSLDMNNRHNSTHPPHGVVVFYGTATPTGGNLSGRVNQSITYSQKFAEQMSHTLNLLEATVKIADEYTNDTLSEP